MRTCDDCGTKMPFGHRRMPWTNPETGEKKLLCNGCHPDGKGPGEGRPVGHHGSQGSRVGSRLQTVVDQLDAAGMHSLASELDEIATEVGANGLTSLAKLSSQNDPIRMFAMQTVAHDSGDGETIYHCPFCGGGRVTGRSDGTVQCGFCSNAFTVQIQPVHPGAPQTINGQPVEWPGQPEGAFQPERVPEPGAETGDMDAETEEPAVAPGGGPPEERKNETPPPFSKGSSFITEAGHVLDAEAYMRHLAILNADDPTAVLAEVRAERR